MSNGLKRRVRGLPAALAVVFIVGCGDSYGGSTHPNGGVPATVRVAPNPITVFVQDSLQLTAVVRDSDGAVLQNAPVTWSVEDQQVASVSQSGKLKGLQNGTTTVTATSTPASGQANVTVSTKPAGNAFHPNLISYLAGNDVDMARDVTFDASGNMVIVGNTYSGNFPVTPGAYDVTHATGFDPPADAFITKVAPTGSVLWSTYLGGPNYERAYAVEVDAQGFIYVGGRAGSGFPVTAGAFQTTFGGGSQQNFYGPQDAFVCKMQPNGTARVWCSYFGVGDDGIARDLDVDAQGNVYLVAWTTAGGFPASWFTNAFKPTKSAGEDVIVAKIKADGSQVLWATYLGSSGDDGGTPAVRVDPNGNVLVLFATTSNDLPTPGNGDGTYGGSGDQFLAKLSPDGSQLLYGTYLGGGGNEASETHGLAVDGQGNAFVGVSTSSSNLTFPGNPFQAQFGGGTSDAVVWKIGPTGTILAGTYYGGTGTEGIQGISTDAQGNAWVSATTRSSSVPTTVAGGVGGNGDVVGVKLSANLNQLLFAQRFGGSGNETARASWFGSGNQFAIVGETDSPNLPELNSLFPGPGGGDDAYVIRLVP
jgi:hypothetical protein